MIITGLSFAEYARASNDMLDILGGVWDSCTIPRDTRMLECRLIALLQTGPDDIGKDFPATLEVLDANGEHRRQPTRPPDPRRRLHRRESVLVPADADGVSRRRTAQLHPQCRRGDGERWASYSLRMTSATDCLPRRTPTRPLAERYGQHYVDQESLVVHVAHPRWHRGKLVSVVGPSGCGKSTLLEDFAGLQHHRPQWGKTHSFRVRFAPLGKQPKPTGSTGCKIPVPNGRGQVRPLHRHSFKPCAMPQPPAEGLRIDPEEDASVTESVANVENIMVVVWAPP